MPCLSSTARASAGVGLRDFAREGGRAFGRGLAGLWSRGVSAAHVVGGHVACVGVVDELLLRLAPALGVLLTVRYRQRLDLQSVVAVFAFSEFVFRGRAALLLLHESLVRRAELFLQTASAYDLPCHNYAQQQDDHRATVFALGLGSGLAARARARSHLMCARCGLLRTGADSRGVCWCWPAGFASLARR